jgi:CheY-like chemotaxis protein
LDRLAGEIEPPLIAVPSGINMPGMDGLQLLVEIKQRFPDLTVMMVTAYSDDERRRQAAEYGAADFLTNSVDFEHLRRSRSRTKPGNRDAGRSSSSRSAPLPLEASSRPASLFFLPSRRRAQAAYHSV